MNKTRFIFITGGVISSLGKGIASAAIAAILQSRKYSVRLRKLDPYLNVDSGTMSPYQHGEVYITDDGAETDLDLGHYERFTGVAANMNDCITSGKIYANLLQKERRGDYLGNTVQIIPHVTNLIQEFILADLGDVDFALYEIGGTVGDIEGQPFLESIRQLGNIIGHEKVLYIHLTLVPYIKVADELKTKPTQHSVKELRSVGIQPNILLCRSEQHISEKEREKIAQFCNLKKECVIAALDQKNIYQVLLQYHKEGLDHRILEHFKITDAPRAELAKWEQIAYNIENPKTQVNIAIVGKYNSLKDAYKSLIEAFIHAGITLEAKVNLLWVNASELNQQNVHSHLARAQAILVPGGFGERDIEGKIAAIKYARENNVPYFGICYGMQLAVIEFARNVLGISDAVSAEFSDTGTKIIDTMQSWKKDQIIHYISNQDKGGSMRLGAYPCAIKAGSLAEQIYQQSEIFERHRHRYEVNIAFRDQLESAGMVFSGMSPEEKLPEIIEIPSCKWFIGVQFHPELKSKPFQPHPLFISFVRQALQQSI
jgi:CTP synthase